MAREDAVAYPFFIPMRLHFIACGALLSSTAFFGLGACGSAKEVPGLTATTDGGKRTDATTPGTPLEPTTLTDGGEGDGGNSGGGRVYAHTTDTLYFYEPVGGVLTQRGKFAPTRDATERFVDLAVDRTGAMFATSWLYSGEDVSQTRFVSVDPMTAKCTEIAVRTPTESYYPNSLSFVPAGTVDATKETLVGYSSSRTNPVNTDYVRIDVVTGAMTQIGSLNGSVDGVQYEASGDMVSIIADSNKAYLTVHELGVATATDKLATVDPKTGKILTIVGDTGQERIYGLGYWAGKGYGFNVSGTILEINMQTGSSKVLKTASGQGGINVLWFGAGATTQAPVR